VPCGWQQRGLKCGLELSAWRFWSVWPSWSRAQAQWHRAIRRGAWRSRSAGARNATAWRRTKVHIMRTRRGSLTLQPNDQWRSIRFACFSELRTRPCPTSCWTPMISRTSSATYCRWSRTADLSTAQSRDAQCGLGNRPPLSYRAPIHHRARQDDVAGSPTLRAEPCARGRDRALRLLVIRLRPRTFALAVGMRLYVRSAQEPEPIARAGGVLSQVGIGNDEQGHVP